MTALGILLIGIAIGRAIGDVLWWIDLAQLTIGLGFIVLGQLRHIQKLEWARKHIQWHMDNPGYSCQGHYGEL